MKVLLWVAWIVGIYLSGCFFNAIIMMIQGKKQGYPIDAITSAMTLVLSWAIYPIGLINFISTKWEDR